MRQLLMTSLAILLLVAEPSLAASSSKGLALAELVKLAMTDSPTIVKAQHTLEQAQLSLSSADVLRRPQVAAEASHGWQREDPKGPTKTSDWTSQLGLTLTQPIYRSGQIGIAQDRAELQYQLAQIQYDRLRNEVIAAVEQAYYRLSLAETLATMAIERRELLDKQFKESERAYRSGFRRERDYLRIKSQYQRAQIQEAIAKDRIEQALVGLAKTVGRSFSDQFQVNSLRVDKAKSNFAELTALEVDQLFEQRTTHLQTQLAANQVQKTKAETGLQVGLQASAQYGAGGYMGTGHPYYEQDGGSWGAALTLSYPLWDWGTESRQRRTALLSQATVEAESKGAILTAHEQHLNLVRQYDRERANLKLNADLLDLEQRNLDAMRRDFSQGQISYLDLVTAIDDFYSAKAAYLNSYFNLLDLRSQYRLAAGRSYESYR